MLRFATDLSLLPRSRSSDAILTEVPGFAWESSSELALTVGFTPLCFMELLRGAPLTRPGGRSIGVWFGCQEGVKA